MPTSTDGVASGSSFSGTSSFVPVTIFVVCSSGSGLGASCDGEHSTASGSGFVGSALVHGSRSSVRMISASPNTSGSRVSASGSGVDAGSTVLNASGSQKVSLQSVFSSGANVISTGMSSAYAGSTRPSAVLSVLMAISLEIITSSGIVSSSTDLESASISGMTSGKSTMSSSMSMVSSMGTIKVVWHSSSTCASDCYQNEQYNK